MDVLFIVGPTAVGKTRLSLSLAKTFNGEIISGDAMQFYQGLDIGTAKATKDEQKQVKHHLLDILKPDDLFSVAKYQRLVRKTIKEIQARNHLPIVVGGSGLFVQAIMEDYQFKGKKRNENTGFEDLPLSVLQAKLREKNPELYKRVDIKNKRRVLRALEKDDSDIQAKPLPYYDDACLIGLNSDRDKLYDRINQRVYQMMEDGLLAEVTKLHQKNIRSQASKAIGYKELYAYLDGQITLDDAISLIQQNSRRYAKRQLTWFRNKMDVTWFMVDESRFEQTIEDVITYIKKAHKA